MKDNLHIKKNPGFTLIELLIVMAIIAIVSTLAALSVNRTRVKARDGQRISDAKTLMEATELYIQDNEDRLPPQIPGDLDWQKLFGQSVRKYFKSDAVPTDPSFGDGGVYLYCRSGHNYMFGAMLESEQTITQDLDQTNYLITDCFFSDNTRPTTVPICLDNGSAIWHNWRTPGPALCQGLDKNS